MRLQQLPVTRLLIIKGETVAGMANADDAGPPLQPARRRCAAARLAPTRQHRRMKGALGEGVRHVGKQEFLVLLLVIEPQRHQLDNRASRRQRGCQQPLHRGVHMRPVSADRVGRWPRRQPAQRPRVAWANRLVIGVVKKAERLVVNDIAGQMRP